MTKKQPESEFVPEIGADELMKANFDDLIVERPCLEILQNSEVLDSIQIINGLEEGTITQALEGKHVGTIIHKK